MKETGNSTPRELLPGFYKQYQLGEDGGQSSAFVKVEMTKSFYIYIPNFDARRKAVLKHDIHHLVTGYESLLLGETEIATWEIASGCKKYWAAFYINMFGFMLGLVINLKGVFREFRKGRRTKNLYHDTRIEAYWLDVKIADIRKHLLLDSYQQTRVTAGDVLHFTFIIICGIFLQLTAILLIPIILVTTLVAFVGKKGSTD
ncbi:MAG: hypothetical protein ACKVPJ_14055 [Chitinophagales bacterium]